MRLQEYVQKYPHCIKKFKVKLLTPTKTFSVMEMIDGEVFIETENTDDEGITTIEVLNSRNRKEFKLIWRERFGHEHNEMRSYPRDNLYPLFCKVNLDAPMHAPVPC
jgi:hypothetical protein